MAKFRAELPDNKLSDEYSNLDNFFRLSGINSTFTNNQPIIHAEGEDIDLNKLLSKFSIYHFPIIIQDTSFTKLEIDFHSQTNLTFTNCIIDELIINGHLKPTISIDLLFIKCKVKTTNISQCVQLNLFILKEGCVFREIYFTENVNVANVEILDSKIDLFLNIQGTNLQKTNIHTLKIINSVIIAHAIFANCTIAVFTISASIIRKFMILSSTIYNNIDISKIEKTYFEIENCILYNTELIKINSISESQISIAKVLTVGGKNLAFHLSQSTNSTLVINQCQFAAEVRFYDLAVYESCIDISINETVFKELVIFEKTQPRKLKVVNSLFQNGVLLPISEMQNDKIVMINPERIHSSVWCVLKNQALQRNDKIIALNYRKNEMNSFKNELKLTKGNYEEKIVLWLNNFSNSHGLSWFKGVCFTILAWVLFFTIYEWSVNNFYFSFKFNALLLLHQEYWTEAISFLWLPQGLGRLTDNLNLNRSWLSSISMVFTFILGKIAIAYGIYQTISAFRKHGKI
jgi:hypothetical protein